MNLEDLRTDIDRIDEKLLSLLEERMEKALLTKVFKEGRVTDSRREAEVIERARRPLRRLVSPDFAESIWKTLMVEGRSIQEKNLRTIGFQGEHGAWSEVAAKAWNRDFASIPCREFVDVFDAVRDGNFDFGIVPVENTLGGLVGPVNAILVYADLRIVAAVDLPVTHCLLALPGTDYREIRQAYSHTQALTQCRGFLSRNHLEPVQYYDTAGAAKMIAEERPRDTAAVASRYAGELYGLEIIKEGIQDAEVNRTRFFVLAREDAERPAGAGLRQKCSAVFNATDRAGGLFGVLEVFAKADINLTRIESVPDKPGDYAIFIDFEGDENEARVAEAIAEASSLTRGFRILGCYDETRVGA
ncbi:MAG TPA: prephenate dehydratase domain-containing protein [Rectinemataceae bacterium]|nr:prephenate dehydratase domain-containing protein [Rectinemataceae bacterium]